MLDDMLDLANSAYLLASSRSGQHVFALLICARLIAPCCAVSAIDARRQHARTIKRMPTKTYVWKRLQKEGSSQEE